MGRKTKLTPDLIRDAEKLVSAGNYVETVCDYLGIGKTTWYRWLERGEKARKGIYREFRDAIKKAEARAEIRAVNGILSAGQDNWQALAWYLERRHHEKWGRKDRLDANLNHRGQVTQRHEYHIVQQIVQNDPERLEAIRGIFRGLNRGGISPDSGDMEGGREE